MPTIIKTEVLPTGTAREFAAALARAAHCLRAGEVVAIPTETVYGLAANALNPEAVLRVFAVKGRPARNPIIVHVAGIDMAQQCVAEWPARAEKLAKSFWPGPLTLVLPRSSLIPAAVVAGGTTVAVRWPEHPFIEALIRTCGFPLAAPSANLSTQISPTTAEHVVQALAGRIPLIIDGGPSRIGIESTVVDLAAHPPRLLRPGMIHAESIQSVVGKLSSGEPHPREALRSPGLLPKHYAPHARLVLRSWHSAKELESQINQLGHEPHEVHFLAHTHIPAIASAGRVAVLPRDAAAFARVIYAELHRCDAAGARLIVVESPPDSAEWLGIHDRLRRAAG
jgi:L-threonylcarbamoyladenylate synthase